MISSRYRDDGIPTLKLNKTQLATLKSLDHKLRSGEYATENLNSCPLCSSKEFDLLAEKDRYGLRNPISVCTACGLVLTNPRMTQEAYTQFYNLEQKKLYVGESKPSDDYFRRQRQKGKSIYEFLRQAGLVSDNVPSSVLEVGCGAGGILKYFMERGHQVKGIDIGSEYINFGREQGLEIEAAFLSDLERGQKYDLIIYSHVMEHVLDVDAELDLIKEYMNPEALLYIEVPGVKYVYKNYKMDYLTYFQNAHTFHFSLTSLTNWLKKKGYTLVKGDEFVRSIYKLDQKNSNRYQDYSNDYSQVKCHIEKVDKNRKLFPLTPAFFEMKVIGTIKKYLAK